MGPPGWADEIKPAQSWGHPGRCLGETGHRLPGEGVMAGLALTLHSGRCPGGGQSLVRAWHLVLPPVQSLSLTPHARLALCLLTRCSLHLRTLVSFVPRLTGCWRGCRGLLDEGGGIQSCLEERLRLGDENTVAGPKRTVVSGRSAQDGVASDHRVSDEGVTLCPCKIGGLYQAAQKWTLVGD